MHMHTYTRYADFVHIITAYTVSVKGTNDIDVSYQHPFNPHIQERPPLFSLELGLNQGSFDFLTSIDVFEREPIALFEAAMVLLHDVPQVRVCWCFN